MNYCLAALGTVYRLQAPRGGCACCSKVVTRAADSVVHSNAVTRTSRRGSVRVDCDGLRIHLGTRGIRVSSKQCVAALFGQHCSIFSLSTLRWPSYEIIAELGRHMIGGGEA